MNRTRTSLSTRQAPATRHEGEPIPYRVKSLERSLRILEHLAEAGPDLTVPELSHYLAMNKTTIFRLLQTLARHGFVEKVSERKYRLGMRVFEMGMAVMNSMDLRREALPILERLNEQTRETIHLTIREGFSVIYIDKLSSPEYIVVQSRVGGRSPLHCTGAGKAVMAYLDENEVKRYVRQERLRRFTPNTITDPKELGRELERIRRQGYAIDNEEHYAGIACVAAPIFDHRGIVLASFSIAGPATRINASRLPELIRLTVGASRDISARLGYTRRSAKNNL
jgi:IclR family KDG regulon transcriptional repressor